MLGDSHKAQTLTHAIHKGEGVFTHTIHREYKVYSDVIKQISIIAMINCISLGDTQIYSRTRC